MAKPLYTTTMISNGGRDGRVFSPDNTFVQNLATPKEMGGQGGNDTNLNNYLLLDIVHALTVLYH